MVPAAHFNAIVSKRFLYHCAGIVFVLRITIMCHHLQITSTGRLYMTIIPERDLSTLLRAIRYPRALVTLLDQVVYQRDATVQSLLKVPQIPAGRYQKV